MKKILITGANSYIGTSFEKWMSQWPDEYTIDTLDVKDEGWINHSFEGYDVVFHVAGIAHVSTDPKMEQLYYKVNRDLTISIANKAKKEQVKQFIFMSSIIVYGNSVKRITRDTVPKPENFYGLSKLQADENIQKIQSTDFNVVSVRPPMIYGKGAKGNYLKLSKLSKKIPFFPYINNNRSMLHIDNLCECIRLLIEDNKSGYIYPQNREYVNTFELVQEIARVHNKKVYGIRAFNFVINYLINRITIFSKVFGTLTYDKELSNYQNYKYCVRNFKKSIELTEEV